MAIYKHFMHYFYYQNRISETLYISMYALVYNHTQISEGFVPKPLLIHQFSSFHQVRLLSTHSDGFLATRILPEPTNVRISTNEETCRTHELRNIHRTNKETRRTNEFQSFTERTKKLAQPTRLLAFTEQTKQWLWLLMEYPRNNLFNPHREYRRIVRAV